MRHLKALLVTIVGTTAAVAGWASAALADSEGPPVETPSNTGTIVVVTLCVIVVVLVSAAELRRVARRRRERQVEAEYEARRGDAADVERRPDQ